MNTHRFPLLGAWLLALAGCSGSQPSSRHEPYVKPALVMLTADQADRRGMVVKSAGQAPAPLPSDLEALDASTVVTGSEVKVYTLNRAVDPADRELLHEQHVAYRRETAPRWKLQAPARRDILVGPPTTDGRQDLQPLLQKELTTFLADQRRATEANQKAIAALFEAVGALARQQQSIVRADGPNPPGRSRRADQKPDDAGSESTGDDRP